MGTVESFTFSVNHALCLAKEIPPLRRGIPSALGAAFQAARAWFIK